MRAKMCAAQESRLFRNKFAAHGVEALPDLHGTGDTESNPDAARAIRPRNPTFIVGLFERRGQALDLSVQMIDDKAHTPVRQRKPPKWLNSRDYWYYSHIQRHSGYVVTVFRAAMDQEVSDERPGTPILRLQPRFGTTRVLDADGLEHGVIRSKGILRGLCFEGRRNGTAVWVSTVRSFVRKRHRLQTADGQLWMFDTPFFWWQHLTGIIDGHEGLIGLVGPTKRHWGFAIETGHDTFDVLSAVAFMHWKWWRW